MKKSDLEAAIKSGLRNVYFANKTKRILPYDAEIAFKNFRYWDQSGMKIKVSSGGDSNLSARISFDVNGVIVGAIRETPRLGPINEENNVVEFAVTGKYSGEGKLIVGTHRNKFVVASGPLGGLRLEKTINLPHRYVQPFKRAIDGLANNVDDAISDKISLSVNQVL